MTAIPSGMRLNIMPQIEIQQTRGQIGIKADRASLSIEQPKATLQMERIEPQLDIRSRNGELQINQDRAWDALAVGNHLEMMNRINRQGRQIALDAIAEIAQKGDRMAQIHLDVDPIPELARHVQYESYQYHFAGPPSFDNVDIRYTAYKPEIRVKDGELRTSVQVNKPIVQAAQGQLDIYVEQWHGVEIIPPRLDLRV